MNDRPTHHDADRNTLLSPLVAAVEGRASELQECIDRLDDATRRRDVAEGELPDLREHPLPQVRSARTVTVLAAAAVAAFFGHWWIRTELAADGHATPTVSALLVTVLVTMATVAGGAITVAVMPRRVDDVRTGWRRFLPGLTAGVAAIVVVWCVASSTRSITGTGAVTACAATVGWMICGRLHAGHQRRLDLEAEVVHVTAIILALHPEQSQRSIAFHAAQRDLEKRTVELDFGRVDELEQRSPSGATELLGAVIPIRRNLP